jgi:hypothetical protein
MKTKFLTLLLSLSFLIGCKNENAGSSETDLTKQEQKNLFRVTVEAKVLADDFIHLYYTEDGSIDFGKNKPISSKVVGSKDFQYVIFNLPEDVIPNELRFDFGSNEKQEDIYLKSIKFDYANKSKLLSGLEIGNFFRADGNNCLFEINTGKISSIKKDGKRQMPLLYPHEAALKNEIEKMIK